ncbi:hypothetical protein Poly51_13840 [Rubripirellula tenax]|uniref:Uncharacterized protein n=1 Tax=Rubripirellula tenax TaxID=2528015 RepID=A0A5C6FB16_9BACT|nr:hypothetical protein Poly51_13840 [Rubripirellula tenax]
MVPISGTESNGFAKYSVTSSEIGFSEEMPACVFVPCTLTPIAADPPRAISRSSNVTSRVKLTDASVAVLSENVGMKESVAATEASKTSAACTMPSPR